MGARLSRLTGLAGFLLALSIMTHFVMLILMPNWTMVDLMVYWYLPPALLHGMLYTAVTGPIPRSPAVLLFTYPPFAAIALMPLSLMTMQDVRWFWQIVSVACLWWAVRSSLRMVANIRSTLGEPGKSASHWCAAAMVWTALVMWLEPVRTTFNLGQINIVLASIVLAGFASRRPILTGACIGLTAGIKLLPAALGAFLLASRQWKATISLVVVFLATVAIGYLVASGQSTDYWLNKLWQFDRVGKIAWWGNQSLRGAISRINDTDADGSPLLIGCILASLMVYAYALVGVIKAGDVLAGLIITEMISLLVAPISWSHHWVWVVPTLIWLLHGPAREHRLAQAAAASWLIASGAYLIGIPYYYSFWSGGTFPSWISISLQSSYAICAMFTIAAVGIVVRQRRGMAENSSTFLASKDVAA